MHRTYKLCLDAIAQGRTVLIYAGVTATRVKYVKTAGRIEMRGDVMYVDGVSAKGLTVAIKPEKWDGR